MKRIATVLTATVALGACAVLPPSGPAVVALPGQGKDLATFQRDDLDCRVYAQNTVAPQVGAASAEARNGGVNSAVLGTALGAAAGAGLGALGGNVGAGAAVGAGAGLLLGGSAAGNQADATSAGLQRQYDTAYSQCVVARGNLLQQQPQVVAVPYPVDPYPYGPAFFGPTVGFGFGYHDYGYRRGYRRW